MAYSSPYRNVSLGRPPRVQEQEDVPEINTTLEKSRSLFPQVPALGYIQEKREAERIKLFERLWKVTKQINSFTQEEEGLQCILRRIVEGVSELVTEDAISSIYLYAEEHKEKWMGYKSGTTEGSSPSLLDDPVKIRLALFTIQEKSALFIDEKHPLPLEPFLEPFDKGFFYQREQSTAALPLTFKDKAIGVLFVELQEQYSSLVGLEEILQLFAEQAAIAIETARLIENLRQLNQQVADQQELVTRAAIANDFVHRINNFAGTIPARIGMIIEDYLFPSNPRDERIKKFLEYIASDAVRILQAAEELNKKPEQQDIDVGLMLDALRSKIGIRYSELIRTTYEGSPNLYFVRAILNQLANAIWNVIVNAVEAMSDRGGELAIKVSNYVEELKPWVKIEIEDTGGGLPVGEEKNIFHLSYTTKGPDRGYGLWRTKSVIESLGGSIAVENRPHVGTKFTILLPAVASVGD